MSLRISKSSTYDVYYTPTPPQINPNGFAVRDNVFNIGFRKSAYAQGKWIVMAASQLSSSNVAPNGRFITYITSTDGITWTGVDGPASMYDGSDNVASNYCQYVDIAFGNNTWVSVSRQGWPTRAISSPDGINWTRRDTSGGAINALEATGFNAVVYDQGQFVIIGDNTSATPSITKIPKIYTSPDGITWTGRKIVAETDISLSDASADISATRNLWTSVAYGNNKWVGVCSASAASYRRVIISTDSTASKWYSPSTLSSVMNTRNWQRIAFGNVGGQGIFVAVASDAVQDCIATSNNGIDWTLRNAPTTTGTFYSVGFGNDMFIAVSQAGTQRIIGSYNGIDWFVINAPVNNANYGVTYANNIWVVNSNTGTNNRILTLDYVSIPNTIVVPKKNIYKKIN